MPEEPLMPLLALEAPSGIGSTVFTAEVPYDRERSSFEYEEPPEGPYMHVKDLRAYEAPFFTLEGP